MQKQIRVSEWSRVRCADLSKETRREIDAAAEAWREQNGLPASPLSFAGPDGEHLCARQYVGVVEGNNTLIEIFPKLDASLLEANDDELLSPSAILDSVMRNLLWMLEVAEYHHLVEAHSAHLEEAPTSFFDLFAFLLGRNLLPELERGVAHTYITLEDNLKRVRGRILLCEQVTRNWNRCDRMRCTWDEFTANTPVNRLFKCACRFLSKRVNYLEATRLLLDCEALLSEVDDVSASDALRDIANLRFDRSMERFKTAFDLARRLLAGIGHDLGAGSANTFVFLLDMNRVFESYVHAVLESYFQVTVEEQKPLGNLLRVQPGGICQFADYFWRDSSGGWIGDAKYKHLARGRYLPLRFADLEGKENEPEQAQLAGHVLSSADVRQLTVYAELFRLREQSAAPPQLMLLYPFVGPSTESQPDRVTAWNGSVFWLMPVLVKAQNAPRDAIRFPGLELALVG